VKKHRRERKLILKSVNLILKNFQSFLNASNKFYINEQDLLVFPLLYKERELKGEVNNLFYEIMMTKFYNKTSEKQKRRRLRQHQTNAEDLVWWFLRNRQLLGLKFRRQYSVSKYVIDFYCTEIKFAIELDGGSHLSLEQKTKDKIRQKSLEKYGINFIRITDDELFGNPNKAFSKIEKAIRDLTPALLLSKERGV
jgi:very-short-patch-repair endonuclease